MKALAARVARGVSSFALALAAASALAGPAPGTVISNQATATLSGSAPRASNAVSLTVGSAPVGTLSAVLADSQSVFSSPGATVLLPHTLTNTGSLPDTYTIAGAGTTSGGWAFAAIQFYPDANGDGVPDGTTPLGAVTLQPGQVLRFVARYDVPATAIQRSENTVRVFATSLGNAAINNVFDRVQLSDTSIVRDCALVSKTMSRQSGPSPAGPINVTLVYSACDKARARLWVQDRIPTNMRYVANSARWSGTGGTVLTDAIVGNDRQGTGSEQVAFDHNATAAGTATFNVYNLAAQATGTLSFDVEVVPGLAVGTTIDNLGDYVFYDASGNYTGMAQTNVATYTVTGRLDVELVGDRVPSADPGTTVTFTNVLTNRGDQPDTYDITLTGSTFPAGTVITLFKSDGVTPLADTDGSGVPDTGVVPAGGTYRIVVRARLPESAPAGSYKVTKNARSAAAPTRTVSADDIVDAVNTRCRVTLDPDNNAQLGFGQHVTYTHFLTNRGNCTETVTARVSYLADSQVGWTSAVYLDNKAAGGGSVPGALDATDTPVVVGWSTTVGPGESLRVLVDVLAPPDPNGTPAAAAPKSAKAAIGDRNVTTVVIDSNSSGTLTVRDTTILQEKAGPADPQDVIRNFTDPSYTAPTFWAVVGGRLYLRGDAASCNAVADVVEQRLVTITGPNGEAETFTATETGPNTGIFTLPPINVRAPPVRANDGTLQGVAGDVFEVELTGCGKRISTVVTLMEPVSVVFDSRTNEGVAGATVTLVAASGGSCGTSPVALPGNTANPVVTGADGRFSFGALANGSYCLAVRPPNGYTAPSRVEWPDLPQGRNLSVTGLASGGSYGGAFSVVDGLLVVDIPVDAAAQDGLFVQKDASRAVVELGEFVDYSVRVRNGTGNALDRADVTLTDDLPAGFAYVAGSARRDGRAIADPSGGKGPRLVLALGTMKRDEQVTITYRVRVGPGALQGDGVNRVQARYAANGASTASNIATARVQVTGGVFTDKGFILGKVFMDCNANGEQDAGELGVPGVRLVLEDGTSVVTDGGGKFSFYGLANRTHVLKADRTSLPAGATLAAISSRHLGDAGSRIVDLKAGELHRADFAISGCAAPLVDDVKRRIETAGKTDEVSAMFATQLATEPRVISDVKALPASGTVSVTPAQALAPNASVIPGASSVIPANAGAQTFTATRQPTPAPNLAAAASVPALVPLEEVLPTLDNQLGFVGLGEGATLPYAQATIRVKGTAGATFVLKVNGEEVPAARVGKRAVLQDKQIQAWEYLGVPLKGGANTLEATQVDPFGNPRGTAEVHVVAPDELGKLAVEIASGAGIADGKTAVKIRVKLTDARGTPVTVRTPVTLHTSIGKWKTADLDPKEPGLQVMAEGGQAEVELLPPTEPASTRIGAESGPFKAEARLDFLPELRSLIATGVLEGIVNLRRVSADALAPVRESDGFERELKHLSREWNEGRTQAGARAAFYLKGKIKGDYLLTAAYDSDKDTKERLFRDIQPDEFYPVYGDSGTRAYDAQSTSRLYVRIDHQRSYLLWGDFTTQVTSEARKLSNYSRSLTGVKQHYENERVSVNAFASRDSSRQVIEELRANGTSGPYQLATKGAIVNSEKVEIIVRDRSQPAIIVSTLAQSRFVDYEIEPLTGRILFKGPVSSVDQNLNPVFVRVTYEVDQGGEQFWVAGVDAQVKVHERVQVGASYVKDKNPLAPFAMAGANVVVKLSENTVAFGEFARTESGLEDKRGDGKRVEVKHESGDLKAQAFVAKTDPGFDNPGAYLSAGRGESGGKLEYKISPRTTIRAEALRTEDQASGAKRDGLAAAIQHQLHDRLTFELGIRHAAEKGPGSAVPAIQSPDGQAILPQGMPDEVTTVRARLTGSIPQVEGLSIFAEAEVDVHDADRRILAAGGEYRLPNKGRLYARHEFVSSITGPYGLNAAERQNTTAIGVDTEYMKDGRLFSEYRIRDAMSGGDVEAALGLKNLWNIAPGWKLGTSFERVKALSGTGLNENTAIALALEYTGSDRYKGSTRLEVRDGHTTESLLFTVGLAARLNRDFTALARNAYTVTRNKEGGGEHAIDRMQAGIAWRDNETNKWNALARVEHRLERDDQTQGVDLKSQTTIFSMHGDWQPRRPFLVSGRYAAKWTTDQSNGLTTKYRAQVIGGRATWEFAPKWDVSIAMSSLFGDSTKSRQYGVGVEVGYLLATNLWVSAGYNVTGYKDADLSGADYTARGPFVRLRYKFDETLLESQGAGRLADHNETKNAALDAGGEKKP